MTASWKIVTRRIVIALAIVSLTLLVAYFASPFVNSWISPAESELRILRLAALGMVAWGVLGRSGWEIQTYKGVTGPERFNSFWFTVLYVIGLFCGGIGILLEPTEMP